MNYTSRSDEPVTHESTVRYESAVMPGVSYVVYRVSFGRRLAMLKDMRELSSRAEFAAAGTTMSDRVEAAVLEKEIECYQLRWGLAEITGLTIDGNPATVETLIEVGPEPLVREILQRVRGQLDLTDEERKNS